MLKKIWKEEEIPEQWRKGIVSVMYKKGDEKNMNNYRGVTLTCTAYKIHAGILNERLMDEIEGKIRALVKGEPEKVAEVLEDKAAASAAAE